MTDKKSVISLSDPTALITPVWWLIPNWIEFGAFNIIGGKGGTGKTTLCVKLAQLNAQRKPFWKDGPTGDGRKSLIICQERTASHIWGSLLGCGGSKNELDVADGFFNSQGTKEPMSTVWKKPRMLNTLLKDLSKRNYAMIIIDPIVSLELGGQNENEKVRQKLESILPFFEGTNTALIGTMHLKKDRKDSTEIDSLRGASEWTNVSTSALYIREMKAGKGYMAIRVKSNHSKTGLIGGIQYKIKSMPIPSHLMEEIKDPERQDNTFGAIDSLSFMNKHRNALSLLFTNEGKKIEENYPEAIIRVISQFKAEGKELDTSELYQYCVANKDTRFMTHNQWYNATKWNWNSLGYTTEKRSWGKRYRFFLVPLTKKQPNSPFSGLDEE